MDKDKKKMKGESFQDLLGEKETESTPGVEVDGSALLSIETVAKADRETAVESESAGVEHTTIVAIEDIEILQSFIQECQEHLANMEGKVLNLEAGTDPAVVDEIFRSIHTMKGNSAFFGYEKMKSLSHALESILDDLRSDKIGLDTELVDILLAGTDILDKMVGEIDRGMGQGPRTDGRIEIADSAIDITPLLARIRDAREAGRGHASSERSPAGEQWLINGEITEKFFTEAADLLDSAEKNILALEKRPGDRELIDDIFRTIHTIKGNAGFLGFGEIEDTCMRMESSMDSIRDGGKEASVKTATALLKTLDSLRVMLDLLQSGEEGVEKREGSSPYKPIGEILVEMGESTPQVVEQALDLQEKKVGEILVAGGQLTEEALNKALENQAARQEPGQPSGLRAERKDIRVDMAKLDKIFDLVGELVTAEAMVIHNPELKGLKVDSFDRAAGYLSKITREMQEITMTVRMIPLEGLFNKMRRLVRDLSRKFGKKIDFLVSGQEIEMDRNVIEEISDPLVHIVRNAIDHGIEDVETRKSRGKDGTGTLSLSARYEGNEIWVSIEDDGAGLEREKILAKAKQRGLLKGDGKNLSDEEVWQVLFEPGFSTAEKVSEISGRGVGMDVVKKNIEKLRGAVDVKSVYGEGSEIILKIPLTLAIMDGITFKVGPVQFAIPLDDILEFHKATEEQVIGTNAGREVLRLREEIIPVIKLHEFFALQTEKGTASEGLFVVVQAKGRKAALLVDGVAGYQQIVVKALPEFMGDMRAISGCSITGDREVSLIIDVGSLLTEELASRSI